jgi:TRAP-type C4-dicarboxylate transport system substrate-binding protein
MALILSLVLTACAKSATLPGPDTIKSIELTVVDVHGNPSILEEAQFQDWMNRVAARSNGELTFKYLGGPEVVPKEEQVSSLGSGLMDVCYTVSTRMTGAVPEACAMEMTDLNWIEAREAGIHDVFNEIFAEHNIYFVMSGQCTDFNECHGLFMNVRITKPEDLKGLRIRSPMDRLKAMEYWGATPVEISSSETYTAVDTGMVDGFHWVRSEVFLNFGLQEVTKYMIDPGFLRSGGFVMINLDKWEELPERIQKIMLDEADAAERDWLPRWGPLLEAPAVQIAEAGVERIRFSPADSKRWVESIYKYGWEDLIKISPVYGPRLMKLAGFESS